MKYGIQHSYMYEVMDSMGLFIPEKMVEDQHDLFLFSSAKKAKSKCEMLNFNNSYSRQSTVFRLPGLLNRHQIINLIDSELPFVVETRARHTKELIEETHAWCCDNFGPNAVTECKIKFKDGFGFGWRKGGLWAYRPIAAPNSVFKSFRREADAVHYKLRWG